MGVLIPVGFGQISMDFRLSGDNEVMTMTYGFDAPPSPDPLFLADAHWTIWTATGRPFAAASVLTAWEVGPFRCAVQTETGILSATGTSRLTGTNVSSLGLPSNCAALIQKRTALGGRRNRGRFYQPPLNFLESAVDLLGEMTIAQRDTLQTAYNAALTELNSASYGMWLLHSAPGAPTQVNALTVQRRLATQRERLRR